MTRLAVWLSRAEPTWRALTVLYAAVAVAAIVVSAFT